MKKLRLFTIAMLGAGLLFSTSSCLVVTGKDNGQHRGWYKNPNNPHHPATTNPGKAKGKRK